MIRSEIRYFTAGAVEISVASDTAGMGRAAQDVVRRQAIAAVARGQQLAFWVMAAPSGFSWYEALVADAAADPEFATAVRGATFYQFDDYPIARGDERFPVTFRHLLESRLFGPLTAAGVSPAAVRLLELDGSEADAATMARYGEELAARLADPASFVIEIKGIGMDGHWGFHGRETPLEAPPGLMRVLINAENRRQQTIDWPEYFPTPDRVPDYAATATVSLFMQADLIVDLVPQPEKAFAVLASYGSGRTVPDIPSSLLVRHPNARSFLTEGSAALLAPARRDGLPLGRAAINRVTEIWGPGSESAAWAVELLRREGLVA